MSISLNSWRNKLAPQQPQYTNTTGLNQVLTDLQRRPGLVKSSEIDNCLWHLSQVQKRQSFVLHIGDCVERFDECTPENTANKYQFYSELADLASKAVGKPVMLVARIAGQYAKPRSNTHEFVGGSSVPVFRGEAVNSFAVSPSSRVAEPQRLLKAYEYSKLSVKMLEKIAKSSSSYYHYGDNFFISHEGLVLDYEAALTRKVGEKYLDMSCHLSWIGDRTRQVDGAHLDFFKGVSNPLAVKIGPSITAKELLDIHETLNPENIAGRLTYITRLGEENVDKILPVLVKAMQDEGKQVIWSVDPMHGNSITLPTGQKTRSTDSIASELTKTLTIHMALESNLSGLHLEVSPDSVTECIENTHASDGFGMYNYTSYCDPRLNPAQCRKLLSKLA